MVFRTALTGGAILRCRLPRHPSGHSPRTSGRRRQGAGRGVHPRRRLGCRVLPERCAAPCRSFTCAHAAKVPATTRAAKTRLCQPSPTAALWHRAAGDRVSATVRELDALAKSLRQGGVKVHLQSTHAARAWGCLTRGTPRRTVLDDCRTPLRQRSSAHQAGPWQHSQGMRPRDRQPCSRSLASLLPHSTPQVEGAHDGSLCVGRAPPATWRARATWPRWPTLRGTSWAASTSGAPCPGCTAVACVSAGRLRRPAASSANGALASTPCSVVACTRGGAMGQALRHAPT